jgi:hypothetical protein
MAHQDQSPVRHKYSCEHTIGVPLGESPPELLSAVETAEQLESELVHQNA